MTAQLINGKEISQQRLEILTKKTAERQSAGLRAPCLAVVLVGDDPASAVYVRNKKTACEKVGFRSLSYELPKETTQETLLKLVDDLNADPEVDGILVQLPLPAQINSHVKVKTLLDSKNIKYEIMDAEENKEYVSKLGIKQAPTLLVGSGEKVEKYSNYSNIYNFINKEN